MEDEQAICRVCRSGSTVSQPLYHPCKCSGSIRFVHHDCLSRWLSHSNKNYCELCDYRFVFTPIYQHDMPGRIPLRVLLRQSILDVLNITLFCVRFSIAVFIWLLLIPTFTTWTWRFYFWTGSYISQEISDNQTNSLDSKWSQALSDCLQGLSITAIVVVLFVAAYLFRDWVIQNTAIHHTEQQLQPPERDRGMQLAARLETLRQELEQRRNEGATEDIVDYNNPYANSTSSYEMQNRLRFNLADDNDIPANPPSGTQSPFASWRDYQQGNNNSSLNDHTIDYANQRGLSRSSSMLRLQEPLDYFEDSSIAQTQRVLSESESPAPQSNLQHQEHHVHPDNANQEPFNFSENMDSFLEAIGMRGSILTLIKNALLMTLMINLCLWITVWIPYVIGRSVISVGTVHFVTLASVLIHTMQSLSGSMTNSLASKVIVPVYTQAKLHIGLILPKSIVLAIQNIHTDTVACLNFIFKSIHIMLVSDDTLIGGRLASLISDTTHLVNTSSWESVCLNAYSIIRTLFRRWRQCAISQGYLDRSVCTFTGYVLLISLGSWYLSRTPLSNGSTNQVFRQQWIFLKVLFFIFLELIVLPTMYGIFLNISTLPLFTDWSIKTRFHFVLLNPYSGMFLHWFVGTGFVLQFSIFIELIREVVRPGVLYFLPSPKDPHYRPVQDIVEQPASLLINRICHMAIVYFTLIIGGMGAVTILVSKYGGIYPIVWKFSNPIISVPVDLFAVQFLLPPIMAYLVPREFSKKSVTTWWHIVSKCLRLSSYMFGGRYPKEECKPVFRSWSAWLCYHFHLSPYQGIAFQQHGGLTARVPSHDHVSLSLLRQRMVVPVDQITLEPLNLTGRRLVHPAVTRFGTEETDTTVVYIPPYFKIRIFVFAFLIWTTGSILVCSITVVPLLLGRILFARIQPEQIKDIHDLYSFTLGAFVMILLYFLLNVITQKYQLIRRRCKIVDWRSLKSTVKKILAFVYLTFVFGFGVPILLGVILDLYILAPIDSFNKQSHAIELYLTMDWALGLAGMNLFHGMIYISSSYINPTLREQLIQLNLSNFINLNIQLVSKAVIAPLILYLTCALILPSISCAAIIYMFAIHDSTLRLLIFRYAYPFYLCGVCCIAIAYGLFCLSRYNLRRIRDNAYLVGKKLHNIEE